MYIPVFTGSNTHGTCPHVASDSHFSMSLVSYVKFIHDIAVDKRQSCPQRSMQFQLK